MKRILSGITLIILISLSFQIKAEIQLPAIFSNNMVLQQQTNAAIWGKASPGKTVKVTTSWNDGSYSAKTETDGSWKLKIQTPVAGGPYSITISDGQPLKLDNILIGEVWVCSGQSNMQMTMKGYRNQPVTGSNKAIATSQNENIRLFTVERNKSLRQLNDFSGDWLECEPGHVAQFSATAYFFGSMMQDALGVPVGLICSSWGGTRIEPWMSESGIKNFDWVELPDKNKIGRAHV